MGRPLNKKFFGNRNIGTTGAGDNGIGGESLASVSNGTVGAIQINNTYKTLPTLNVAAPTIPGGVTAITAVTWEIADITIGGTNTGYTINQTNAPVTDLNGLYSQTTVDPVLTINTNGTGNVTAINITSRGEFTSLDGTSLTSYAIIGAGGSNAQATVTFRIKSIAITEKGSGYTALPSLSWSAVNGGTMPSAQTPSLTVDTGAVGSATNQENAILMTARLTGGTAVTVDVIRQVSTNRYKVTDGTRTGIVKLKSSVATAAGEGSVKFTDSVGGTYFATKITARKATITRGTGIAFASGTAVKWNMTAAVLGDSLLIENA
jgi:hypothetical protein